MRIAFIVFCVLILQTFARFKYETYKFDENRNSLNEREKRYTEYFPENDHKYEFTKPQFGEHRIKVDFKPEFKKIDMIRPEFEKPEFKIYRPTFVKYQYTKPQINFKEKGFIKREFPKVDFPQRVDTIFAENRMDIGERFANKRMDIHDRQRIIIDDIDQGQTRLTGNVNRDFERIKEEFRFEPIIVKPDIKDYRRYGDIKSGMKSSMEERYHQNNGDRIERME